MRNSTLFAVLLWLLAGPALCVAEGHGEYFEHFEGTQTCLSCHEDAARAFFQSQHYQWRGSTPDLVGTDQKKLGKINTINDFCTNPGASWIGLTKNSRGEVLAKGCSACHAGLGIRPEPDPKPSLEKLENIDCLICHASGYRRDLYPTENGGWEWKPILWRNQEGLDSVSKRISLPTRTMCLRCHSASGGGPNFKRGDLEYALRDPGRDFDVHMSSEGASLECVGCHAGEDHRVRGRGADLPATDLPESPLTCADGVCHDPRPHGLEVVDRHTARLACTTCHIPTFAREDATDMVRDWSRPTYNEEKDKHAPTITLEKDVTPVYAWWNGKTRAQLPGVAVKRLADGTVGMMMPDGDRSDPKARIHAFKLHRGRLPILEGRQWIVPIMVEEFFADGDIDKAVREAAHEMYGVEDPEYGWVDTQRYMGIFHEVQPAAKALGCLDCHRIGGRMDWKTLGYDGDPLLQMLQAGS